MISKKAIAFVMMLAVSAPGMAFASDIYNWTDEHGNVYSFEQKGIAATGSNRPIPDITMRFSWLTVQRIARWRIRRDAISEHSPSFDVKLKNTLHQHCTACHH